MESIIIIGPMFSCKTTELISRIDRLERTGKRCIIIRSLKDTRTEDLRTHSNIVYNGVVINLEYLSDIDSDLIDRYDVFGIDEGHFFSPNDLESFLRILERYQKILIVAMLKATHKREPFEGYSFLYARSTEIRSLNSICEICKGTATNTRMKEGVSIETLVGGEEKYFPCCNKCWSILDKIKA